MTMPQANDTPTNLIRNQFCEGDLDDAVHEGKMATRRDEFTDRQKADIFVRDRALCGYSGKSLWLLDYGVGGGSPNWVDHIRPASRNGRAELENGVCASWLYNKLKGASGGAMLLFYAGQPTEDYFTFYQQISPELAAHLRRFTALHYSDWYLNKAISGIILAAALHAEGYKRVNGGAMSRGLDSRAKVASRYLVEWAQIVAKEKPGNLKARGLLPPELSPDQELLLSLTSTPDNTQRVKAVAVELAPVSLASWNALAALAHVDGEDSARELLHRVESDSNVVLRVKRVVRTNLEHLYPSVQSRRSADAASKVSKSSA
jgi:hypothetical protein